jgi:hypothetical protein
LEGLAYSHGAFSSVSYFIYGYILTLRDRLNNFVLSIATL